MTIVYLILEQVVIAPKQLDRTTQVIFIDVLFNHM